ncbi:lipopolysaccharide transport periplasmic protein LptA [Piscirickettsia litoralis]|uniref:lipopolysaccharide transport periplasmic protein LptA n=1 Tax=Piscirickettsia litoralis TaxID=1891921 RepID=UPI001F371F23|nr:lipopolysaccharide transport periplasmic protein LptA [Piscirickettsia litoralis]
MKSIKFYSVISSFACLGIGVSISLAPLASYALSTSTTDSQQAIKVTSNTFWANNIKGIAIYSGNVIADQGSRHLTGSKLTLYRDNQGQVKKIIATGHPAKFRYKPKDKLMTAEAETITVYPQTHKVDLDGKAKLTQAGDTFSAPQIFS